jgi:hypothetical protein
MRELLSGLVEPLSENDLIDPFGLTDSEPNLPALDIKDFQTRDVW